MKSLWIALQNEALKQKGTPTVDIMLFLPALIIAIFTLFLALAATQFKAWANPWLSYYRYALYALSVVMPLLASFLGFHLQDIEFRSSGHARAFLFPVSRFTLYAAKVIFIFLALGSSALFAFLTVVLSGKLLDWWEPAFGFRDFAGIPVIAAYFVRFVPYLFAMALLQFWTGYYSNNLLVALSIAVMLLVVGAFLGISTRYYWLFPGSWLRNVGLAVNEASDSCITTWFLTDWLWVGVIFLMGIKLVLRVNS